MFHAGNLRMSWQITWRIKGETLFRFCLNHVTATFEPAPSLLLHTSGFPSGAKDVGSSVLIKKFLQLSSINSMLRDTENPNPTRPWGCGQVSEAGGPFAFGTYSNADWGHTVCAWGWWPLSDGGHTTAPAAFRGWGASFLVIKIGWTRASPKWERIFWI